MTLHTVMALVLLSAAARDASARDAGALPGGQLAAACASCHGAPGQAAAIPPVAGQDEDRILGAMRAYREGTRNSQVMHVVANALSPAETDAVAHYLAGQRSVSR